MEGKQVHWQSPDTTNDSHRNVPHSAQIGYEKQNTINNHWSFPPQHMLAASASHQPYEREDEEDDDDEEEEEEEDYSDYYDEDGLEEDETAFNLLYARNQSLSAPEITHERLEWQQMLQSVLMGEVIKSEKKRLSNKERFQQQKPTQEIWLSLRALLRGRTAQQEQQYLEEGRKEIDKVLEMVMDFKVKDLPVKSNINADNNNNNKNNEDNNNADDGHNSTDDNNNNDEDKNAYALKQVADVLKSIDRIESLYTTRAEMTMANPQYGSLAFQTRLDALNSWCTITRSLRMQYKILRDWTKPARQL